MPHHTTDPAAQPAVDEARAVIGRRSPIALETSRDEDGESWDAVAQLGDLRGYGSSDQSPRLAQAAALRALADAMEAP